MDKDYAEYLLKKTKDDYNLIAEEFSRTRQFIWDLEPLSQYVWDGEKVLDLACGNGRLLEALKHKSIDYFGIDSSEKLIEIAKRKYGGAKFQVADVLSLPFPNNFFDKIFSIRILHHIPSENFRIHFLKETKRVLKPEGLLILTVWNVWRSKHRMNLLRMIKYGFLKIIGKSNLDFGDVFVPWKIKNGKILRYYHFFTKNSLKNLIEKSNFKAKETWLFGEKRNHSDIYLIAEK